MRLGKPDNLVRLRGPACWRGPRRRRAYARRERHDFVAALFEFAQKRWQHGGGLLLGIVQQQNPAFLTLDPREDQGEFLLGVISSQSEPQKSAPKTPIFRADRKATSSGVSAKPGNRKNGTFGAPLAVP